MAVAVPLRERVPGAAAAAGAERRAVDRAGGRGGVADIQRARIMAAMAHVARERGIGATTVADVVARSGVSRRTFYELFEDRDDCFRAAFDHAVERAARRIVPAYESAEGGWRERMRAGLGALLEFLDDEPDLGRLCVVDALGAGPMVLARRAEVVRLLVDAVCAGGGEAGGGAEPTRLTAEGVVGAVLSVLHARLSSAAPLAVSPGEREASMVGLLSPLMAMVVLPYLGKAAAVREGAKPAPRPRPAAASSFGRSPRELGMRLTYRTVQVLLAVAATPGASNRQVADVAGVADPGQISKLLARLEQLGLIRNDVVGPYRGEPNAWSLTEKGAELERTTLLEAPSGGDRRKY